MLPIHEVLELVARGEALFPRRVKTRPAARLPKKKLKKVKKHLEIGVVRLYLCTPETKRGLAAGKVREEERVVNE